MAAISVVPRPEASASCACGGTVTPGVRYEATKTVDVVICWTCGTETPPMYGRRVLPRTYYCRFCGLPFTPTDPRQRYCSTEHSAHGQRITSDRRSAGQLLRRRAV